jgi:lysozyme
MSEGGTYTDPKFVTNWNAAKTAGLKVNAYHYFRALSTLEEQVANIKKNLLSVGFDLTMNCLAIDVESRGNESASRDIMADHLQNLLTQLKCDFLYDFNPMIYCSPAYWDNSINWKKYDFSGYPLWIANWNVDEPRLPKSWELSEKSWSCWQYSSKGRINGIKGDVDLDWVKN